MTRQEFIRLSALYTGGMFLPLWADSCTDSATPNPVPILVIGAGTSGLATAKILKDKGFTNVIVLEGRNRIGGRVWTNRTLAAPVDLGASWIHGPGGNNPITPIASAAGAQTFMTDEDDVVVYDLNGAPIASAIMDDYYTRYVDLLAEVDDISDVNKSLSQAINEIDPTLIPDPIMSYQLSAFAEFDGGGSIDEMSSMYWADDSAFPGKDVVLPSGYDAVVNRLATGLDIRLNHTVNSIDYNGESVLVNTSNGNFSAKYVVVTVPLGVLKQGVMQFSPALPASKTGALGRLKMGHVNKVALQFPTAFWDTALQFFGHTSDVKGKYTFFMNTHKFNNSNILVTFGFGDYGLLMEGQTDAQIIADVMAILRNIYGNNIPNPSDTLITRWGNDPFSQGSYSFASVGSSSADYDLLAEPVSNKIFFAGEHTHSNYRSTVHGAYLSGVREANRIADLEG